MRFLKFTIIAFILFIPLFVFASDLNLEYPFLGIDLQTVGDIGISGLVAWLYYMIIMVAVVASFGVLVWGGIEYLTSAGNQTRMKSAIDRIQNAIIGLLLVLISGLAINTISPSLLFLKDPILPPLGIGGPVEFPSFPDFGAIFPDSSSPEFGLIGNTPYGCPTQGILSSPYGYRCRTWATGCSLTVCENRKPPCWALHPGIDLAKRTCKTNNYPVYATADGTVVFRGLSGTYGYRIDIQHIDGYLTRYAHLKSFNVLKGQIVYTGQVIAMMGGDPEMPGAGSTTGCHLHYEVRINNAAQNPANYMNLPCS